MPEVDKTMRIAFEPPDTEESPASKLAKSPFDPAERDDPTLKLANLPFGLMTMMGPSARRRQREREWTFVEGIAFLALYTFFDKTPTPLSTFPTLAVRAP